MADNILYFVLLGTFTYYAMRLPKKETVDGATIFALICAGFVFGLTAGMTIENEEKIKSFNSHCNERAKGVYLCDFRYEEGSEPTHSGTGKYND